jgi:hypothetical protein
MNYQLTYRSIAVPTLGRKDINDILEFARDFNSKNDITGCLVYSHGYFVQILEGEVDKILALMKNIELDTRHTFVDILSEGEVTKRMFTGWDMAFLDPSEKKWGDKAEELKRTLLALRDQSIKPEFTYKLFWQNVGNMVAEKGYFKK